MPRAAVVRREETVDLSGVFRAKTQSRQGMNHEKQVCGLSTGDFSTADILMYAVVAVGRIRLCRSATGAPSRPGIADASTPGSEQSDAGSFLFPPAPQASVQSDKLIRSPLRPAPRPGQASEPPIVWQDRAHRPGWSVASGRFRPDSPVELSPASLSPSLLPSRSSCSL